MHHELVKRGVRAFDHGGRAFYEVQHLNAAASFVQDGLVEPMPAGFDKLPFMEPRPLLGPTGALGYRLDLVD